MVFFKSLEKEHIFKIIDLQLAKVFKRINLMGFEVKLTEKAKEFIADKGFDQQFGARPLNRAIQKYLEDPIADEILKGLSEGDTIVADFDDKASEIKIKIKKGKKAKLSKGEEEAPAKEEGGE